MQSSFTALSFVLAASTLVGTTCGPQGEDLPAPGEKPAAAGSSPSSSAVDGSEPVEETEAQDDAVARAEGSEPGQKPEQESGASETPTVPPDGPTSLPDGRPIAGCGAVPEGMACIPGGAFERGSDDGPRHARPAAEVWLQTYFMDIHEVTYAEYKSCEASGACPKQKPYYQDFDAPRQPMNGLNWYAAVDYCKSKGKHLPTEAQWEKAARGPEGAVYPWGDEPATCELAVIKDATGRSCGIKQKGKYPDKGRPNEIGSRPPGVYGLYDMAGNSWEWVADWYSSSWEACGEACQGIDPLGPCDGAEPCGKRKWRTVRGGSWYWEANYATGFRRRPHVPSNSPFHHFGFRCAASVDEARAMNAGGSVSADATGREPS
jgi:formylglycine-generating enzyme required for sulfatase activity